MRCLVSIVLFFPLFLSGQNSFFEKNIGQYSQDFLFSTEVEAGKIFFHGNRWVYHLRHTEGAHGGGHQQANEKGQLGKIIEKGHAFEITFLNANSGDWFGQNMLKAYRNYFLGDRKNWRGKVPLFKNIRCRNLYPGIDVQLEETGSAYLKYNFIIKPGANPDVIAMQYSGMDNLILEGEVLHLEHSLGTIQDFMPEVYQMVNGEKIMVDCQYVLENNVVRFQFPKGYDSNFELVIDPASLIFSTYSASTADNWGYTATYNFSGNHFAGGISNGTGYPTSLGAYQTVHAGGVGTFRTDVTITKWLVDGSGFEWSSYLGGSATEIPHSFVVNRDDELIVFGTTSSSDFPISAGAYDSTFGGGSSATVTSVIDFSTGSDMFVTRFKADGSDILGSTFLGGSENDGLNRGTNLHHNYGDHARGEVIVNREGKILVASSTESLDFPTTSGAYQTSFGGGTRDAVLFQFDPSLTSLEWSTFYGASGNESAYGIALNSKGEIYISGGTTSPDLPVDSTLAYQGNYAGGTVDGFIANFSSDGSSLDNATFMGTPQYDQCYFVQVDRRDKVYVIGQSDGSMPVSAGVYSNPSSGIFIHKLKGDLQSSVYSTVIGSGSGRPNITPTAFLVDICENVYFSGWGGTVNFSSAGTNTTGLPVTSDAYRFGTDGSDFYLCVLETDAVSIEYATFFGSGVLSEHVDGGTSRFDRNGIVYQTVCAGCGGSDAFPTTIGAYSRTNESTNCNVAAFKLEIDLSSVTVDVFADPAAIGCPPLLVNFVPDTNTADQFIWDFGDGSALDTSTFPSHTYTDTGEFIVRLIGIDSNSCNIADTAYTTVIVREIYVDANFSHLVQGLCDSLIVDFDAGSDGVDPQYYWDFGDGGTSNDEDPQYTFRDTGTFTIRLIVEDSFSCNELDTFETQVTLLPRLIAGFDPVEDGCVPHGVQFVNHNAGAGFSHQWNFGDGGLSAAENPYHVFNSTGPHTVTLITSNSNYCNGSDTFSQNVFIFEPPVADFDADPYEGSFFETIFFVDKSKDGVGYFWDFGDGNTSTLKEPNHQYAAPGEYEVCLRVSAGDCDSTICKRIILDSDYIVDIPNAFTPNSDGLNDILRVINFGLKEMEFKVFNRWGQLLFQTTNSQEGWDGNYKGKEQETGVYVYTVSALSFEDEEVFLKGNISLIR